MEPQDRDADRDGEREEPERRRRSPTAVSSLTRSEPKVATNAARNPNATHLICWRSTPPARRNRMNTRRDRDGPRPEVAGPRTQRRGSRIRPSAVRYNGLSSIDRVARRAHGRRPEGRARGTATNSIATIHQRNGFQRGDGRWPSGNNSGRRKRTGRIPNNHPRPDNRPRSWVVRAAVAHARRATSRARRP